MIESHDDQLVFRFPDVHEDAVCTIDFQRTLRIPDDNRDYPLPPGLGRFPLEHVEDHGARLPPTWAAHGGVLLPMYQAEGLWIDFGGGRGTSCPFAVKIAAGKINAVTGDGWRDELSTGAQDYLVLPAQPWLDGYSVREGLVRQFVAMPLGQGYTAEEQISGAAEHGGIQIIVYPMKRQRYERLIRRRARSHTFLAEVCDAAPAAASMQQMGLAPGGLMRQHIHEDEHGHAAWDTTASSRCFVHLLNSTQWSVATGRPVPGRPPSAADYTKAGLPWFDHYDDSRAALPGARKLTRLDSVAAAALKLGHGPLAQNVPVEPRVIVSLGPSSRKVGDGRW